jgi:hypothetical protein
MNTSDRIQAIKNFDMSFVHEKAINDKAISPIECVKAEEALKKFFILVLLTDDPLAMIDKRADALWHTFILFTPQYKIFCENIMGFFVHHQPRTSLTPVPSEAITNFVFAYKKVYGELDAFWMETLNKDMKAIVETGIITELMTFDWSGWTGKYL